MKDVRVYRIVGWMNLRGEKQKFSVEVPALKKEHALEKILSVLGSRHRVSRRNIIIDEVEEVPPEQINDPAVKQILSLYTVS